MGYILMAKAARSTRTAVRREGFKGPGRVLFTSTRAQARQRPELPRHPSQSESSQPGPRPMRCSSSAAGQGPGTTAWMPPARFAPRLRDFEAIFRDFPRNRPRFLWGKPCAANRARAHTRRTPESGPLLCRKPAALRPKPPPAAQPR